MKCDVTYACGHKGHITINGPARNRTWYEENRLSSLCPSCYKEKIDKERKEKDARALKEAQAMELPELIGSERQKTYANFLRVENLKSLQRMIDKPEYVEGASRFMKVDQSEGRQILDEIMQFLIQKNEATYWFQFIEKDLLKHMKEIIKEYLEIRDRKEIIDMAQDLFVEATIAPKKQIYSGVVRIEGNDSKLKAIYVKNENFRALVKSMNMTWDGESWFRKLNERTGQFKDRAGELGNVLLREGFTVCILDNEARKNAIEGNFIKECKRWFRKCKDKEQIIASWEYTENRDIFNNIMKIPSAKYKNRAVYLDPLYYEEIIDFAEIYNFSITHDADMLLKSRRDTFNKISKVDVQSPPDDVESDKLRDILMKSGSIIDELEDEDEIEQ